MKKVFCVILIMVILTAGIAAYAVYDEEDERIDYELVLALTEIGMKPDMQVNDWGMIWTGEYTFNEYCELMEDEESVGEGMVYLWYDAENNIGSMTVVGNFEIDEESYHFIQWVFEWSDSYCDFDSIDGTDAIYW